MQLATGVIDGELPVDGGALLVASGLPGGDLGDEGVAVADAAAEALARQHRELQLGHVEPTAVDRGVVELQLPEDAPGLVGRERLVERARGVGVQVVQADADAVGVREVAIDQVAHLPGEVVLGALVGDVHMSPGPERLGDQEEIRGSLALVLVVDPLGLAWRHRQGDPGLSDQLLAGLVEADGRAGRVVRLGVQIEDVLHPPDEVRADRRDDPLFLQPRLELVLLRSSRIASSVMSGTICSSTTRSARSCIVQRSRPSGGFVQANATTYACCLGPSFGRAPGRACSRSDASNPSSTNRRRVRSTVATPIWSAFAMSSSIRSSAANSSVCARRTIRTEAFPFRVRSCSRSCSSSVRVTRYRFAMILPSTKKQHHGFCLPITSSLAEY